MACCWRCASALLANMALMKPVAAPCMKLLTTGFVVLLSIIRLALLVSMSCLKLPVFEIMAPPVEVAEEEDPDPHSCAAVSLGPESAVFAGMVRPSGQVTATPDLHGPTAVAVGVLCALTKVTAAAEITAAMKMISVRFLMFPLSSFEFCQIFENLGG